MKDPKPDNLPITAVQRARPENEQTSCTIVSLNQSPQQLSETAFLTKKAGPAEFQLSNIRSLALWTQFLAAGSTFASYKSAVGSCLHFQPNFDSPSFNATAVAEVE